MNSTRLDPVVAGKLQQFGRRRRRLIWIRGICAGVISFLVFISAIALADWTWVLADHVRWSLSALAYAAVVISVWLSCLRRVVHKPAMRELATRMEVAEPELRENLLSAVELATDDPALINDSPAFRSLLQGKVARRMTTLRVSSLLPWRLLGGWLAAALLLVAAGTIAALALRCAVSASGHTSDASQRECGSRFQNSGQDSAAYSALVDACRG